MFSKKVTWPPPKGEGRESQKSGNKAGGRRLLSRVLERLKGVNEGLGARVATLAERGRDNDHRGGAPRSISFSSNNNGPYRCSILRYRRFEFVGPTANILYPGVVPGY